MLQTATLGSILTFYNYIMSIICVCHSFFLLSLVEKLGIRKLDNCLISRAMISKNVMSRNEFENTILNILPIQIQGTISIVLYKCPTCALFKWFGQTWSCLELLWLFEKVPFSTNTSILKIKCQTEVLWCLTLLSIIFQFYQSDQFY